MDNIKVTLLKYFKFIEVIGITIILTSCSTVKENKNKIVIKIFQENKNKIVINNLPENKNNLITLSIRGIAIANVKGQSNSLPFNMKIYKSDTLSMTLSGPLGITLGELFATNDSFLFYSLYENFAITGKPDAENLSSIFNIPISFNDLIHFARNEVPTTIEKFYYSKDEPDLDGRLFINNQDTAYIEYAVISNKTGYLTNYQRKNKTGEIIVSVIYKDFQEFDNFSIPGNIIIQFPKIDAVLNFEYNNIKINKNFDKHLFFNLPNDVKQLKL
jgi:hypothetical protein